MQVMQRKRPCWVMVVLSMFLLLPNESLGFLVSPQSVTKEVSTRTKQTTLFEAATDGLSIEKKTMKKSAMEIISSPLQIDLSNVTALEMVGMSAIGLTFSLGVIFALASSGGEVTGGEGDARALEKTLATVVDVSLPADATDILTIALGESIGGFIGAMSTSVVTSILRLRMEVEQTESLVAEAVADGDYFFTRAAALPLLEVVGIPPELATVASVLLATVPYEFVKLASRRRQQKLRESDRMMKELLQKQQRNKKGLFGTTKESKDGDLPLLEAASQAELDIPDVLTDIIKWLEYDVLYSDFGGTLMGFDGSPLPHGVESAIFGFLAGMSSLLYLDIVRTYTDFGPESKRVESRTRSLVGWVSLYSTESLSSAALFGVYETARRPIAVFVADILSGGVDGCLGSSDFQGCVATYVQTNAPEASLEAQVRSLVTTLASLWDRLSLDGAYDDTQQAVRASAVQLYNIAIHAMPAVEANYNSLPIPAMQSLI